MMGWFTQRLQSFGYAASGIVTLFKEEQNARIHLLALIFVVMLGSIVDLSPIEWSLLILCIVLVFLAELINSAIESVCDEISLEKRPFIKKAKDLAAGAVLVSAIGTVVVGFIILGPALIEKFL